MYDLPVISFDKKYLYGLIGEGIDDDKFSEQVSKLGFGVEEISKESITVELTANRLDLLDAVGLARSLRNFMHKSKRFVYEIADKDPGLEIKVDRSVRQVRPFIAGIVARRVKLDEQALVNLINFSEKFCETYGRDRRKIAIGMHNLDAVKPGLTYRCSKEGRFVALGERDESSYSSIIETLDKGRQYSGLVKGRKGNVYPELIDGEGAIALIPVINSERTRVTAETKNMFVDITGTSAYAANKVSELLASTFIDMGADVKRVRVDYGKKQVDTPILDTRYITIPVVRAEREIGVRIGYNNVISLANKMGYEAALVDRKVRFRVPEYRLDVIGEQDVIEDLAIAYGYDYINPMPIYYAENGELEEETKFNRTVAEIMTGLGFSEFANSYLTNDDYNFDRPRIKRDGSAVVIKNPKTEAISIMRTWILPSILRDLSMSANDRTPQNVFELDLAFKVDRRAAKESYHLAAASLDPKANFNNIKATVEGLLYALGVKYDITEQSHGSFIEGRCADIRINGKNAGVFGEIHPEVLKNFGLEEAAVAFEMDVAALMPKS
ncbi:MAG: phenylalanine--tRNA ligase subunit beta [Candidatus Marsarchaeota archaeon]|nr:phenylalanine--tRNA ligase subunit beta [Candidatus Marsarchaeota archaeon]